MRESPRLPDFFRSKEMYEEWLTEVAEHEVDEFLDLHEGETINASAVYDFADESPILDQPDWEWVRLYNDVRAYSEHGIPMDTVAVGGRYNPFPTIAQMTASAVALDLGHRLIDVLRGGDHEVER